MLHLDAPMLLLPLVDQSGTGNDGEINGDPEWDNGKFGKAMVFDGVDDFVLIPNDDSYNFATDDGWISAFRLDIIY